MTGEHLDETRPASLSSMPAKVRGVGQSPTAELFKGGLGLPPRLPLSCLGAERRPPPPPSMGGGGGRTLSYLKGLSSPPLSPAGLARLGEALVKSATAVLVMLCCGCSATIKASFDSGNPAPVEPPPPKVNPYVGLDSGGPVGCRVVTRWIGSEVLREKSTTTTGCL